MAAIIGMIICTCAIVVGAFIFYSRRSKETSTAYISSINGPEALLRSIELQTAEALKTDVIIARSPEEYEQKLLSIHTFDDAFKNAPNGNAKDREITIPVITDFVKNVLYNESSENQDALLTNVFNFKDIETLPNRIKLLILIQILGNDLFYIFDVDFQITEPKLRKDEAIDINSWFDSADINIDDIMEGSDIFGDISDIPSTAEAESINNVNFEESTAESNMFTKLERYEGILTEEELSMCLVYSNDKYMSLSPTERYSIYSVKKKILNSYSRHIDNRLFNKMFTKYSSMWEPTPKNVLHILATFAFEEMLGYQQVDPLPRLNIDGFEIGTCGESRFMHTLSETPRFTVTKSVWIQIKAAWIHLEFMDLGSIEEMRRIVTNLSNTAGTAQLVEQEPIKVTDHCDGARIAAARPSVANTFSIFFRKFTKGGMTITQWLNNVDGWMAIDQWIYYSMRALMNMIFTGQQNTGKTTLMKGAVEYYPEINIRVFEKSWESELNELYPHRNIELFKDTNLQDSDVVQNFMKKTDGGCVYAGETADKEVACNVIQFANVAAECVVTSAHPNDTEATVDFYVDSRQAVMGSSKETATYDVTSAFKTNVRVNIYDNLKGIGKIRRIEYIEEIIPRDRNIPYPTLRTPANVSEAIYQQTLLDREYYTRQTDRKLYDVTRLFDYDSVNDRYLPLTQPSKKLFDQMLRRLPIGERLAFAVFVKETWG